MKQLRFSLIIAVFAALLLPFLADAQRAARSVWPKKDGVYLARSSETIPPFPRTLSGYRATGNLDYWDNPLPFTLHGSVRIHQGFGWQGISDDFPMTMNHCSAGAFMIRWRSIIPMCSSHQCSPTRSILDIRSLATQFRPDDSVTCKALIVCSPRLNSRGLSMETNQTSLIFTMN